MSRSKFSHYGQSLLFVSTLATRNSCVFQQSEHTLSGFTLLRCAIPTHTGLTQRWSVRRSAHSSHTQYDRPSRFTALQLTNGNFLAKSAWFGRLVAMDNRDSPGCSINFKCPFFHSPSRVRRRMRWSLQSKPGGRTTPHCTLCVGDRTGTQPTFGHHDPPPH
jgi:hypothetical protein